MISLQHQVYMTRVCFAMISLEQQIYMTRVCSNTFSHHTCKLLWQLAKMAQLLGTVIHPLLTGLLLFVCLSQRETSLLKKRSCCPLTKQEFWKSITQSTHSWCNNISIYIHLFSGVEMELHLQEREVEKERYRQNSVLHLQWLHWRASKSWHRRARARASRSSEAIASFR